jgi:hypothetical protein
MAGINYGRVIGGGLVAGVILNVFDAVGGMTIFAQEQKAMFERLHLPAMDQSFSAMLPLIVIDFLIGIIMIFTYAAIRPRYGPGPKTAALAAFLLYATVTILMYAFTAMGIFTPDAYVKNAVFYAVSWILAGVAGAAVYKEA